MGYIPLQVIGGRSPNEPLMQNENFLREFRSNPSNVTDDDVCAYFFKNYLNAWGCRIPNSPQSAAGLKAGITETLPFLRPLSGVSIKSVNFAQELTVNGRRLTVSEAVEYCYKSVRLAGHRIAATATGKILHILNPELLSTS